MLLLLLLATALAAPDPALVTAVEAGVPYPGGITFQPEGEADFRALTPSGRQVGQLMAMGNGGIPWSDQRPGSVEAKSWARDRRVSRAMVLAGQRYVSAAPALKPPDSPFHGRRFDVVGWVLGALAAGVAVSAAYRRRLPTIASGLVPAHLLIVGIQSVIYLYWGLHVPAVRWFAPLLLVQLAFAFAVDAGLSWIRYGSWRVGLGWVPIVGSASLFAWYLEPSRWVTVITVALAAKHLVPERWARAFNPSATGLAVLGLGYLFAPRWWAFDGVVHFMPLAPNMAELVLILALIPQLRLGVAITTVGAVVGLEVASTTVFPSPPGLTMPSTLIALTLLITDPRSSARSGAGRLLQGLTFGFAIAASSKLYLSLGLADDFSKILPVPFVNLMAPLFDRLAARMPGSVAEALEARWRLFHIAMLWMLVAVPLAAEKAWLFEPAQAWSYPPTALRYDREGVPTCAVNPAWCTPFGVLEELAAWTERPTR